MRKSRGFTIVELLIVIVVIAILAAISIVAYNGIQNRANDTAVQSDLANIAKKIEAYKITSTTNEYPASFTVLGMDSPSISKNAYGNHYTPVGSNGYNFVYCRGTDNVSFAVIGRSKSGTTYAIANGKSVYASTLSLTTNTQQCPNELGLPSGSTAFSGIWHFSNGTWIY